MTDLTIDDAVNIVFDNAQGSLNAPTDTPTVKQSFTLDEAVSEVFDNPSDDKQTAYVASKEDGIKNLDLTGIARQNNVSIYEARIAEKELRAKKAEEMNLKTMQQLGSYDPALKEKFKNDPAKLSIVTALDDAQNIGAFGRFVKDVSQSWGLGVATSEMADLNFKQFMGQELTAIEQNSLNRANRIQESKINYGDSLYGIPQATAETAPLILDSVFSKEAITGASAWAGYGAGAGGYVGASIGAVTGFGYGVTAKMLEQQIGLSYGDLKELSDENGDKIDETTARGGALVSGVVGTALELVGIKALSKTIPQLELLKQYATKGGIKTIITNPTARGYLKTIGNIVKGAGVEGATEAMQTLSSAVIKELTKASSGQEFDLFTSETDKEGGGLAWLADTLEQASQDAVIGAKAGLGFGVVGTAVSKIANKAGMLLSAKQEQQQIEKQVDAVANSQIAQKDIDTFLEMTDNPENKIYANALDLQVFFQDKPDIYAEFQDKIPEITKQLNDAIKSGGDLILPSNKVASAIQSLNIRDVIPIMRLSPLSLSETDPIAQINDFDYEDTVTDVKAQRVKDVEYSIKSQLQNANIPNVETQVSTQLLTSIYERAYDKTQNSPDARKALDDKFDNLIIRSVTDAEQLGKMDDMDLLIERARIERSKIGKFKKRPLVSFLEAMGGVKSDSSFGRDLASRGIPKRALKANSTFRYDAIPVRDFEDHFGITGVPDDGQGYVDTNFMVDILDEELAGNDWTQNYKGQTPVTEAKKLLDTLSRADIDIATASNKDIKKALIGKQLFQETQNDFDPANGTPYTEKTIDINGVTRSAVNSNGQPIAQTKEGLESFWNWFGDSKVVDDNGNPLVVYHGTIDDFDSFQGGNISGGVSGGRDFYFTPSSLIAESYTKKMGISTRKGQKLWRDLEKVRYDWEYPNREEVLKDLEKKYQIEQKNYTENTDQVIMPVYLAIKDPLVVDAEGRYFYNITQYTNEKGRIKQLNINDYVEKAKNNNNKGLIVKNVIDTANPELTGKEPNVTYVAFDSTQIKSVFNRGTFDPDDARILYQKQGKGKESIKRGSFVALPNNISIINVFKDRDKSTILHETGHYLLETYKAMAQSSDAPQDIIDDWKELKGWLELKDDTITTDAHETFARGFEAYLMTGKAPSVFLLDIFRTFKRWLVGIYKTVKNLKVSLTPEVTAIFDRMLASEQEIQSLKNMNMFTPDPEIFKLLTKAEQEDYLRRGEKQAEQASEKLLSKKIKELAEKEKELTNAERETLTADARVRIYSSPVHKMRYFFDNDKMPLDGQALPIETGKIDRQKTIDFYGEEFVKLLPAKYFQKDGLSPDYLADTFGFVDGGEMLNALVNAPKAEAEIKRTVNEDILNRYGDAFNDGTLERDALDSVHDELAEQGIIYEYQVIERTASNKDMRSSEAEKIIQDFLKLPVKQITDLETFQKESFKNEDRLKEELKEAQSNKDYKKIAIVRAEQIKNQTTLSQAKKAKAYIDKILSQYKDYASKQKANPEEIYASKQIEDVINSKEYLNLSYNDFLNLASGISDIRSEYTKKRNEVKQASKINPKFILDRAKDIIGGMATDDAIKPERYYRAEIRASAEVQKALAKKDYKKALEAKERQLLNHYLYREARNARNFTSKALKRFNKYKKKPAVGKVKIDEDYRQKAVELIEMFDFQGRSKSKAGLKDIEEWRNEVNDRDGSYILDFAPVLFGYTEKQHYRDMKYDDFYSFVENVESIIAQGRLNRSMEIEGKKQDIADIAAELTKQVTDNFDTINVPFEPRTQLERAKRTVKEFFYSTIKARTLLRELDGFKEFGNFYKYFLKPINEASQKMIKRQQQVAETLNGIFDKHYANRLSGELNKKTFIPEIGQSLSKQAMISYALNYGAIENRSRLLSQSNLTESQLNAVLGQLTKNDYMFVQDVWDFLESFKNDIWALEKKRNGIEPQEVQKVGFSVTTKDGESLQLAGGYYPIKYEQEKSSQVMEDTLNDLSNLVNNSAQTKRGHTKGRLKNIDKPLRNDLGVLFQHVTEVVQDLEMGDVLQNSYKLLKKKDLSNAIIRAKGKAFFNQLEWWIQDQAIGGSLGSQGMESILGGLRAGVSVATIGLKLSTILVQITGFTQTASVIGVKHTLLGMAKTFGNGNPAFIKDAFQFAYGKSKILNNRAETFNRDVNDALRSMETGGKIKQKMTKIAFYPMIKVQSVVDVMVWHGAYQKALDIMGADETKAIEYADDIIVRSQGSGALKDLSALERGTTSSNNRLSAMVKLFTVYYNYFNTKLNIAYDKTKQTNFKDPISVLNLATDYLLLYTLEYALGSALLGQLPSDDDDYLSWLLNGAIGNIAGQLPLVREAYSVTQGFDGSPSGIRGLKDVGTAGAGLLTATANAFDEDKNVNVYELLRDLNMAGGVIFKYPASQINQTLRAIEKSSNGKDVGAFEYLLYKK